jgi:hypothetical protein
LKVYTLHGKKNKGIDDEQTSDYAALKKLDSVHSEFVCEGKVNRKN